MRLTAKHTQVFMLVAVGLCLLYEVASLFMGQQATISELVWNASENTVFVFAVGFLMGHWFFPKSRCAWCGQYPFRKGSALP